jgi:uncharacterized protein with von Willebrand factor type A (vWA) domain
MVELHSIYVWFNAIPTARWPYTDAWHHQVLQATATRIIQQQFMCG